MENKVVGYIPKILYRFYLYLKNRFDPPKPVPEEEQICYNICKKLIRNDESKLTLAPLSNKRFIKNDDKSMFIVIENRVIMLINHIYSYTVYCENDEGFLEMVREFDQKMEYKRQELESEIKSNIQHSLKKIYESIS